MDDIFQSDPALHNAYFDPNGPERLWRTANPGRRRLSVAQAEVEPIQLVYIAFARLFSLIQDAAATNQEIQDRLDQLIALVTNIQNGKVPDELRLPSMDKFAQMEENQGEEPSR